jgi:hypothetical protein
VSHSSLSVSSGIEVIPNQNMSIQRLKVAILPLDLPCSGIVTHSGKILAIGKSFKKKIKKWLLDYKKKNLAGLLNILALEFYI